MARTQQISSLSHQAVSFQIRQTAPPFLPAETLDHAASNRTAQGQISATALERRLDRHARQRRISQTGTGIASLMAGLFSKTWLGPKLRRVHARMSQRRSRRRNEAFARRAAQAFARRMAALQRFLSPARSVRVIELPVLKLTPASYRLLEPRMVFDGAAADTAAHFVAADKTPPVVADKALAPAAAHSSTAFVDTVQHGVDAPHDAAPTPGATFEAGIIELLASVAPVRTGSHEIAVVDMSVANAKDLVAGLPEGIEVITIDASRDGVGQLAAALAGRHDISAIHILSHGTEGKLYLGASDLNAGNMGTVYGASLASIRNALTADADILIYGCDFAKGQDGIAAAKELSRLTGADVAASTDETGASELGGNWELEEHIGQIDVSAIKVTNWDGLLAKSNTTSWSISGTTATNTTQGITTTITFTNGTGTWSVPTAGSFTTITGLLDNSAAGTGNLSAVFNATTQGQTGRVTITFSVPVTNPEINIDRLGGNYSYTDVNGITQVMSNSSLWTLVSPGLTLTQLSGTSSLIVTSTTLERQVSVIQQVTATGAVSTDPTAGTAAGTVRVNGTNITSITFDITMDVGNAASLGGPAPYASGDGVGLGLVLDASPVANADSFSTSHDAAVTLNVTSNDTDPSGDTLTVKAVNGTAITAGGASVAVTGGSVALNVSGLLVFTPIPGTAGAASFTYTVSDANGGTSTATVSGTVTNTAPVLDLDTVATGTGRTTTFTETGAGVSIANPTKSSVTDTDDANMSTASVVLTNKLAGDVLSIGGTAVSGGASGTYNGLTYTVTDSGGQETITFSGQATKAIYQAVLEAVTYANSSATPSTADRILNVTVSDTIGATSVAAVSTIHVVAVNSPPAGADTTLTAIEDTALTLTAANFGFSDVEGNTLLAVKITTLPTGGTLTDNGVAVTAGQSISIADINAGKLKWTAAANANGVANASFKFQVQDNGGTANGGIDLDPAPNTIVFDVTPVNDAPAGADKSITATEDTPYALQVADFGFSDPNDSPANSLQAVKITTLPANGSLTLNGIAVTAGQTVAAADIAAGKLVWTPAANANGTGLGTFTFQAQDNGGTANGGADLDATPNTIKFNVTAVADPVTAIVPAAQSTPEDTALVFSAANGNAIGFSDPDNNGAGNIIVKLAVPAGTLTLGGTAGLVSVAGNGTGTVYVTGTLSSITAALNGLKFAPPADYNGSLTSDLSLTVTRPIDVGFQNSGFEAPAYPGGVYFASDSAVPGWDTSASDHQMEFWSHSALGVPAFEGDQFVELNAYEVSTLSQTFTPAAAGGQLTVTFAHRGRQGVDTMRVTATDLGADGVLGGGDDTVLFTGTYADGNTAWGQYQASLGTASGHPILLQFESVSAAGGNPAIGNFLDAISIFDSSLSTTSNVAIAVTPVADIVNDAVTTREETAITFNAMTGTNGASADNFESGTAQVTSVTQPTHGSVTFAADGTITYTPDANFAGTDTLTYTVTTANNTETATITINVTPVNDAPAGADKTITAPEDTPVTLTTADFGFGDPVDSPADSLLAVKITTVPAGGTLRDNGVLVTAGQFIPVADIVAGKLVWTPAANAYGTGLASFTFQVEDNGGTANGGVDLDATPNTITFDVTPVNDTPVGSAPPLTTPEDTPVNGVVTASDVDGDALTFALTTSPIHGTVTVNPDGTYTYVPAANYNGPDSFDVTVSDGHGGTAVITVPVTVTPVNDPPAAANDTFAVAAGNTVAIAVLGNDTDVDGDTLGITHINGAAISLGSPVAVTGGTVTLMPGGILAFTPDAGFSGIPVFNYTISDGHGGTDTATVTGRVLASQAAPVIDLNGQAGGSVGAGWSHNSGTTAQDVLPLPSALVQSASSEVFGPALSGAVTGTMETLTNVTATDYANAVSSGSYVEFTFTTTAGLGLDAVLPRLAFAMQGNGFTVSVVISSDNFATSTLLLKDFSYPAQPGYGHSVVPTADFNLDPSTTYTYRVYMYDVRDSASTPASTIVWDDTGFYIAASDPASYATTFTEDSPAVAIAAPGIAIEDADSANMQSASIVLTNAMAGDVLNTGGLPAGISAAVDTSVPGRITVTLSGSASLASYQDAIRAITFANTSDTPSTTPREITVSVSDGTLVSNTAVTTINVIPVNDAPVASNDTIVTPEDTAHPGTLPAATDPEGDPLTYALGGTHPTHGTVTVNPDGTYVYTPSTDYNGPDSFTYTVSDGAATVEKTVTIAVIPVNDTPVGSDQMIMTAEDTPLAATLPVATDVDGDPLTYAPGGTAPSHGTVAINPDGTYTYTPAADHNGPDTFTYTVSDGSVTIEKTVTIQVTPVNDAPVASSPPLATLEDTPVNGAVTATDVDGDALTFALSTSPAHGTVTINPDGTYTYVPAAGYNGPDSFTVTVADGHGGTALVTVPVAVTLVNDAPTGADKTITSLEDVSVKLTVADFGFSDPHDTPANTLLAVTITSLPGNGTMTLNGVAVTAGQSIAASDIAAGKLVWTPAQDANGSGLASFTFQVQDDGGTANGGADLDPAPKTITFDVTPVNDAPVIVAPSAIGPGTEDTALPVTGFAISDIDSPVLTTEIHATHGILNLPSAPGVVITGGGTDKILVTGSGSDITAALSALSFVPEADYNGTATVTAATYEGSGTPPQELWLSDSSGRILKIDMSEAAIPSATNDTLVGPSGIVPYDMAFSPDGNLYAVSGSGQLYTINQATGAATLVGSINGIGFVNGMIFDEHGVGYLSGGNQIYAFDPHDLSKPATLVASGGFSSAGDLAWSNGHLYVASNDTNGNGSDELWGIDLTNGTASKVGEMGNSNVYGIDNDAFGRLYVTAGNNVYACDPTTGALTLLDSWDVGSAAYSAAFRHDYLASQANQVNFLITPVPDAVDDALATQKDTPVTFNVLTGTNGASADSFEGTPAVTAVSLPAHGTVTFAADGTMTYAPEPGYSGTDSFTYTVTSPAGITETATVTITINAPPVDGNEAVTLLEDAPVSGNLLLNASDADGDVLHIGSFAIAGESGPFALGSTYTIPGVGELIVDADGSYTFTPASGFNGQVPAVTYDVIDGRGGSVTSQLILDVTSVNDAPLGADKTITAPEDTPVTLTVADFGFSDPADAPANNLQAVKIATLPANGILTLDGVPVTAGQFIPEADIVAGKLVFTPAQDANGAGLASFTFQVQDDGGTANGGTDLDPAPKTLTFDVTSVNDAPLGADKTITAPEDTPVTLTTADFGFNDPADAPANNLQAVKITTLPANGTLTLDGVPVTVGQFIPEADIVAGKLVFTPAQDANGSGLASFTFQVQDDGGTANGGADLDPAPKTLTFDVTPVNDAPVASSPPLETPEDTPVSGAIKAADVDGDALTCAVTDAPIHGTVTVNPDGTYTYVPAANYNGPDSFTVTVSDGHGGTALVTVPVTISPVNDAPVARDDAITTIQDRTVTFDPRMNDSDIEGDALRVTAINGKPVSPGHPVAVSHGTVAIGLDGKLTFTPETSYYGSTTLMYTIDDGHGGTSTATISVTVKEDPAVRPGEKPAEVPQKPAVLPEPVQMKGMILDAINKIAQLGSTPAIGTNGIVLSAVNGISDLGDARSGTNSVGDAARPLDASRLADMWNGRPLGTGSSDVPTGLTGFSLRLSLNDGGGSDTRSQLVLNSLVRERTLIIQLATNTGAAKKVVDYRVMRADGAPMPGWLDRAGQDVLLGERPANVDSIQLRIIVIFADGTSETRLVEIETISGEIKPLSPANRAALPQPFLHQFAQKLRPSQSAVDAVIEMLQPR